MLRGQETATRRIRGRLLKKGIDEEYYLRLPSGPPTQGDIWANLPLPASDPPLRTGIVITPRCDLAYGKSLVVNYLPIIGLNHLLMEEGGVALLEQELTNTEHAIREISKSLGVLPLIEVGMPADQVLSTMESGSEKDGDPRPGRSFQRSLDLFRGHVRKLARIREALAGPRIEIDDVRSLVPEKLRTEFLRKVVHNIVADLHFLPPCSSLLPPSVIELRKIGTCSLDLLTSANESFSQTDWDRVRSSKTTMDFAICQRRPERLLRLKSPYLEALMARFGSLFARVGVRDIPVDQLDEFVRLGVK